MQFWEKFRSVSSYLTILRRKNIIVSLYHAILRKKSELQKSLNCEIKHCNYFFIFLFSGWNGLPHPQAIQHVGVGPW